MQEALAVQSDYSHLLSMGQRQAGNAHDLRFSILQTEGMPSFAPVYSPNDHEVQNGPSKHR